MSQKYEKLGKYLLLEKLSSGSLSENYLAKSSVADGLNKFFTIKRMLPQHATNKNFISLFRTESRLSLSLNHGNIISVFDSEFENGLYFTVMDYIEGFSLQQMLTDLKAAQLQFSIEQTLYLTKEIAAGLNYAHMCVDPVSTLNLNIVHANINPKCVLISLEGGVKILDFGTNLSETPLDPMRIDRGYMSPEQLNGLFTDQRTDLFSLGAILCELLGKSRNSTPELEAIAVKAINKDINKRYQTASEFYRELNRYLNVTYPDFSGHDFSRFIKNFYAEASLKQKTKLLEFAKIQFEKSEPANVPDIYDNSIGKYTSKFVEKTQVTTTSSVARLSDLPEGFGNPASEAVEFSFEKLNKANPFAAKPISDEDYKSYLIRPPAVRKKPDKYHDEEIGKNSFFTDVSIATIVIAILVMIGFEYKMLINRYSKKLIDSIDQSSIAEDPLAIKSGRNTMDENYSAGVIARMRANKQLAYLNIRVIDATSDTRIFINGKELLEKSPVKMYPIFASQDTIVSVLSSKTNRFDAKKISVNVGEIKTVQLKLRKN